MVVTVGNSGRGCTMMKYGPHQPDQLCGSVLGGAGIDPLALGGAQADRYTTDQAGVLEQHEQHI